MFSNQIRKIKQMLNLGLLCAKYRQEALQKQYEFEIIEHMAKAKDDVIAALIVEQGGTCCLTKETMEKVINGNYTISSSTDEVTGNTVLFVNDKSE